MISMIACEQEDGGIGYKGDLLWKLPDDLRRFKQITWGAAVVMGRKTWDSLPGRLEGRHNIVLSRSNLPQVECFHTVEEVRRLAKNEDVFIIGGASLYAEFIHEARWLYLTQIWKTKPADTFFPKIDTINNWWEIISTEVTTGEVPYTFRILKRKGV